jgi:hypothetical protein
MRRDVGGYPESEPIGAAAYSSGVLSAAQRAALRTGVDFVSGLYFGDLEMLATGVPFSQTTMRYDLPAKYLPRYDLAFAQRFLIAVLTVAWKLRAPGAYPLASVAEELALHAVTSMATSLLEQEQQDADLGAFDIVAYEDMDFLLLFDPAYDGVQDTELPLGSPIANLRFADWFRPFRASDPVHPLLEDEEEAGDWPPHEGSGPAYQGRWKEP